MLTNVLTDAKLRALPVGHHTDGERLMVRVSPHGVRTFFYRHRDSFGKMQSLTLGRYPTLSLAGARDLREKCRELIEKGLHPKLALQSDGPVETFFDVAQLFKAHYKNSIKAGEAMVRDIDNILIPTLGGIKIGEVKPIHVLECIKPIIARGSLVQAAKHCVRAKQIVEHAKSLGLVNFNSLDNVTKIVPKRKVQHQRALPPSELPALVQGIASADISMVTRNLTMFILLTACRANEASSAEWQEIDFENRVWSIPAARMKMSVEHRVPLSAGALKILEEMKEIRCNKYIFFGRAADAHANPSSPTMALRRAKLNTSTHGLRSLFSTYMHEKSDFSSDVIENCLAHRTSGVRGAYLRSTFYEARVAAMAWWAAEVERAGASGQEMN